LSGADLVLRLGDRRMAGPRDRLRGVQRVRQARHGWQRRQSPRIAADGQSELFARDGEVALGRGERRARRGDPRLGDGDVGAGGVAQFEPFARGAQFLLDQAHVALPQAHDLDGGLDVDEAGDGAEQHPLLDADQPGAQRQHRLARYLDAERAAAEIPEHHLAGDPGADLVRACQAASPTGRVRGRSPIAPAMKFTTGSSAERACTTSSSAARRRARFCSSRFELR
jgi:hypothetical protein